MSVTQAEVAKIARLARIRMSDEELAPMTGELNKILAFVEHLSAVDTSGVPPLASVVDAKGMMREDIVNDGNRREDILANAPRAEHGFFAVPKVIE